MKVQLRLFLCFVSFMTLVSLSTVALASCGLKMEAPVCQEYWRADAVFIGVANKVVNVRHNKLYLQSTAYFTIEEAFKGVEGTDIVFDSHGCGYLFKEGERYLVYARRDSLTKQLEVHVHSPRTRPLSEAAEDLQYIRGLPSTETATRVFGKITQYHYNIQEKNWAAAPLQNIKVTFEGKNQRNEVVTDSEGWYEFKRLLPGRYRIRAEITAYSGQAEKIVEVTERGCLLVDFLAVHKGQITGEFWTRMGSRSPVSRSRSFQRMRVLNKFFSIEKLHGPSPILTTRGTITSQSWRLVATC